MPHQSVTRGGPIRRDAQGEDALHLRGDQLRLALVLLRVKGITVRTVVRFDDAIPFQRYVHKPRAERAMRMWRRRRSKRRCRRIAARWA